MAKKKTKSEFVWGGFHPFSYHPVIFHFITDLNGKNILDLGCGKGVWGYLIRAVRSLEGSRLIGVDIDKNYLKFCKEHKVYDKLINSDITSIPLKNKSIDFLICSEVIEHLTKKNGLKFLSEVDRLMQRGGRAIITTPNMSIDTFIENGKDSHSSVWTIGDFERAGYKVFGMGIRINPSFAKWYSPVVLALGNMITPISYFVPEVGGFLIAVKDF